MTTMIHFVVFGALIYLQGVLTGDYNISNYLGTHIDLECESETPVDCIWKVNEIAVYIGDHYHYIFSNGSDTTDCSIQIPEFQVDDVGNWTCWSLATDESNGQLLNSYHLTTKDHGMEDKKNSTRFTIAVKTGMAVILDCKFDVNLEECHWLRNSEPIAIINRYKFVNFNQTGSDCSINITSFKYIDFGTWQCITSANTLYGYKSSYVAWLTSQEMIDNPIRIHLPTVPQNFVTEHPLDNINANIGDTVTMRCNFKEPVHCVWLHNERPIHVGHHYHYAANHTIGSKATNCTLTISNILLNDIGRWTCVAAGYDSGYAIRSDSVSIIENREKYAGLYWTTLTDTDYTYVGSNQTMHCLFGNRVYCDWARNGQSVKISNRYSFDKDDNEKPQSSCSLRISPVKYLDAGNWSCSIMQLRAKVKQKPTISNTTLYVMPRPVLTMNNRILSTYNSISVEDLQNENNTLLCTVETRKDDPIKLNWKIANDIFPGIYQLVKTDGNNFLGKLHWGAGTKINFDTLYRNTDSQLLSCECWYSANFKETVSRLLLAPVNQQKLRQTSYMPSRLPTILGDTVKLNCTFNKPVNCSWKLNNTQVTNSLIYQYIDTSEGRNTTNCSISVKLTPALMQTTWSCENMPTYTNESARSYAVTLTIMKTPATPAIKSQYITIKKILLPLLENIYDNKQYQYSKYLRCSTESVFPGPTLQWEANGQVLSESSSTSLTLYSSQFRELARMKNVTQLKCVMRHPTLKSPKYATLELERYRVPIHPVIKINGEIKKTNVTLLMNEERNIIICECQNGYPSANLYWNLDGQKLSEIADLNKVADFQYTTTLQWYPPVWKMFKKTMQLNCVAEHPGWDNPEVALATITFVYNIKKNQLQLVNEDRAMHMHDNFVFQCISSQPTNCFMMLNDTIVKEISSVSTSPANDLIQGHIIEHCYIEIPSFDMKHIGRWRCTNGLSESNEVNLTPFAIPMNPRIELEKSNGSYINENNNEIIMKNAEEKLKLTCIIQRSNPKSTLRWILNGNNITTIPNITTTKSTYYLHDSILRWDSALNFTQTNESAVLGCVALFPTAEIIFKTVEIRISIQKRPSKPVIFFNDKMIVNKVDVPETSDFDGFKCISEKGNPAAKLYWQVNGQGMSGRYENNLVKNNEYISTLHWNPKNNDYLAQGELKLACVATHPSLNAPITHGIHASIKARTGVNSRSPETIIRHLPNQAETSALHYFVIALLSSFAIIVTILTVIIYIRIKTKRSSGNSLNTLRSCLCSYFGRKQKQKDSPLIKYHHCEGENECQATIVSTSSEN